MERTGGRNPFRDREVSWLLRQINHLYRVERKLRHAKNGLRLRTAVRAHQAKPVYARLHRITVRFTDGRSFSIVADPEASGGMEVTETLFNGSVGRHVKVTAERQQPSDNK